MADISKWINKNRTISNNGEEHPDAKYYKKKKSTNPDAKYYKKKKSTNPDAKYYE